MHSVFSGSVPVSPGPSQPTHTITSESAVHLREQVRIVSDLYQQRQYDLSPPEREWIQNAISYTRQILDPFFSTYDSQHDDDSTPKRFRALHALTLRSRQPQPPANFWNSQFLIAMQNLNSAMNLLSWSVHASQSLPNARGQVTTEPQMRPFLSRSRLRREELTATGSQSALAELRATSSLTQSTNRQKSSELPLTLVETVELWRENAEDALKDAMLQYFEQEEMLRGRTDATVSTTKSLGEEGEEEEEEHTEAGTDDVRPPTPPKDATVAVPSRIDDTQKRLSMRQLSLSKQSLGVVARKPLASPSLDLGRNHGSTLPATSSPVPTSSSLSARSIVSSSASACASARDTNATSTTPSPIIPSDDHRSTNTPTPRSPSQDLSSFSSPATNICKTVTTTPESIRRPSAQLDHYNNHRPSPTAVTTNVSSVLDVQPETRELTTASKTNPLLTRLASSLLPASITTAAVSGNVGVGDGMTKHQKSRGRMRLERMAAAAEDG